MEIEIEIIEKLMMMICSGLFSGFFVYYFMVRTEEYRFNIYQRKQAEKVAELFARWIKYQGKEEEILNREQLRDYYEELNRLSFELAMWIPGEKLVNKIMNRLSNAEGASHIKEIIVEIRELILEKKSKELKANDLVHFYIKH